LPQARRKKEDNQLSGLTIHISRGLREAALFILLAISLFLLTALVTHDIQDPGWSYTGPSTHINNMAGAVGSWFSDVLLFLFGLLSYLFPIMIAYSGWLVLRGRKGDGEIDFRVLGIRWVGFFMTLTTGCALASLHFVIPEGHLPLDAGGILGRWMGDGLAAGLGVLGSTLILLAVFLAGITLFTGLSWIGVMDFIGDGLLRSYEWMYAKIAEFKELREEKKEGEVARQTREKAVIADTKKQKERKVPVRIEPVINKVEISERHNRESQIALFDNESVGDTELPPLRLLDEAIRSGKGLSNEALEALSRLVEIKLKDFKIDVEVVAVHPGPVITRFELQPAPGIKASKITGLSKDLARSLSIVSVRVVEVIPGKTCVGLEIPNEHREMVLLGEILMSKAYDKSTSALTIALGKDISGQPVVADLAKMPHLLVAGTTGSGKSVGINAMLVSLLYKSTPEHVRLILIDPKMLELNVYDDIPHLLTPVVTDMSEAANALRWAVGEMENRYKLMAALGVRNITGYNRKVLEAIEAGTPIKDPLFSKDDLMPEAQAGDLKPMPFIVVVVDEFADLIMVVGKKIEELIARLAQKARASGIHLILATQRPSVDVITGLIKANIPSRIAFQVSSRTDSRTILDQMGAEQLLGHGDMLYLHGGTNVPERVHGAFVDDHEVHAVVNHIKKQAKPSYIPNLIADNSDVKLPGEGPVGGGTGEDLDVLYDEAVQIVTESGKASISYVQRRLKIGYNRAARMVEEMEATGVVSAMQSNGQREVLAPPPPDL